MADGNDKRYLAGCDTPAEWFSVSFAGRNVRGWAWWIVRGQLARTVHIYGTWCRAEVVVRLRERGYPLMTRPSVWVSHGAGVMHAA